MDDYIDTWHILWDQIDALKKQQDAIAEKLMENMAVGEVLISVRGNKIRKCDRAVLDPDRLKDKLSTSMWTRITKRVPVAALYKAEIERGKLSKLDIEESSTRSTPWIEKR